jgi:hypothetical protein
MSKMVNYYCMEFSKTFQILTGKSQNSKTYMGPPIFFIIITSVQRVLFFTTPLPLKVYNYKSSEKNDDGGRFH